MAHSSAEELFHGHREKSQLPAQRAQAPLGGEVGRSGGSEAGGGTPSPCSLHLITFATTGPHQAAHTGYFCFISFTSLPALPSRVRARQKQNSQQVWLILGPCF